MLESPWLSSPRFFASGKVVKSSRGGGPSEDSSSIVCARYRVAGENNCATVNIRCSLKIEHEAIHFPSEVSESSEDLPLPHQDAGIRTATHPRASLLSDSREYPRIFFETVERRLEGKDDAGFLTAYSVVA